MRIHFLQHAPFEGPGTISDWAQRQGARTSTSRLYSGDALPRPRDFDCLIVLGGPMSVHDEKGFPWLVGEKRFLREVAEAGKMVLGICLGSQLLAEVLGGRVFRNPEREVGWFPVEKTEWASQSNLSVDWPDSMRVMHWHGETFELPPDACHLARSPACENQAFSIEDRLIGLQFHLEATPEWVEALALHCPDDLRPGRWVQSRKEMLERRDYFELAQAAMERLLAGLLGG